MATSVTLHLQTQVVSIVEALAKSAIAEIRKVIDAEALVSRLEFSQSKKENETLKWRLLHMEKELEAARRGGEIRAVAGGGIRAGKVQVGDEIRGADKPDCDSHGVEQSFSIDGVFGKEWSVGLWKDGELTAMKVEEAPSQPVMSDEVTRNVEDRPGLFSIKVELLEGNLEESEPREGLKIGGGFESEGDSAEHQHSKEPNPLPAPAEVTEDPYARPLAAGSRPEQHSLPVAMEGVAKLHERPVPLQSAVESEDARRYFLRGKNADMAKGQERARRNLFACTRCGRNFSYFISFRKHQQTCSGVGGNDSRRSGEPAGHESAETSPETAQSGWFGCGHCEKTFGCLNDLETHQAVHGEGLFRCDDCGIHYLEKRHLDSHACSRARGRSRGCAYAGDYSSQESKLESSHRVYREGHFYSCADCRRSFANVTAFDQYLCDRSKEKAHRCSECGKCFTERSSLKLHRRTIHGGERPYSCAECGKHFTQKANFQKHQVVHTGEKPHQCLECGKRFTEKGYLKKHYLIHTAVKPYRCRECGRCFYHLGSLNSHERTHRSQATPELSEKTEFCPK